MVKIPPTALKGKKIIELPIKTNPRPGSNPSVTKQRLRTGMAKFANKRGVIKYEETNTIVEIERKLKSGFYQNG